MPTIFKRYRCFLCNRTVVVWKLRKFFGRKVCPNCVDKMYEFSAPFYQNPPNKKDVLSKSRVVKVPKKTTISPPFGG